MQKQANNYNSRPLRQPKRMPPGFLLALTIGIGAGTLVIPVPNAHADKAGYHFTAVAYIGGPAPGGGAFVNDFEPTALNNRGQLAFTAEPHQPGEEAVFLTTGRMIKQVMRFGQNAPGTATTFSTLELGNLGLNDNGDLALAFTLEPYQVDPFILGAVYRYPHQTRTLSPVVLPGMNVPGVGTILGAGFQVALNNHGALAFAAFVHSPAGPKQGVFLADKNNAISTVAMHGTDVPGVGKLDIAQAPWINDRGDVAFSANTGPSYASSGVYVKWAASGKIQPIPAPQGFLGAYANGINNRGDVAIGLNGSPYIGDGPGVQSPGFHAALYLRTGFSTLRIAGAGDPAPVGGFWTNLVAVGEQVALNNRGEVAFNGATDTGDEAILVYSKGSLKVVAHLGTTIPAVGTIHSLEQTGVLVVPPPPVGSLYPGSNATLNDHGQVAFVAILQDGRAVLLLATPHDTDENDEE